MGLRKGLGALSKCSGAEASLLHPASWMRPFNPNSINRGIPRRKLQARGYAGSLPVAIACRILFSTGRMSAILVLRPRKDAGIDFHPEIEKEEKRRDPERRRIARDAIQKNADPDRDDPQGNR